MQQDLTEFRCGNAAELLGALTLGRGRHELDPADVQPSGQAILDFLRDEGAELTEIEPPTPPGQQYQAILSGKDVQIRISSIALDSIRDFIVLSLVLASVSVRNEQVPMALVGAAVASLVRSSLTNIHKLDEYAGERCVVRTIMKWTEQRFDQPINRSDLFGRLHAGRCVFAKCGYRKMDSCGLGKRELGKLLSDMVEDQTLRRRGTSGYELPW